MTLLNTTRTFLAASNKRTLQVHGPDSLSGWKGPLKSNVHCTINYRITAGIRQCKHFQIDTNQFQWQRTFRATHSGRKSTISTAVTSDLTLIFWASLPWSCLPQVFFALHSVVNAFPKVLYCFRYVSDVFYFQCDIVGTGHRNSK